MSSSFVIGSPDIARFDHLIGNAGSILCSTSLSLIIPVVSCMTFITKLQMDKFQEHLEYVLYQGDERLSFHRAKYIHQIVEEDLRRNNDFVFRFPERK